MAGSSVNVPQSASIVNGSLLASCASVPADAVRASSAANGTDRYVLSRFMDFTPPCAGRGPVRNGARHSRSLLYDTLADLGLPPFVGGRGRGLPKILRLAVVDDRSPIVPRARPPPRSPARRPPPRRSPRSRPRATHSTGRAERVAPAAAAGLVVLEQAAPSDPMPVTEHPDFSSSSVPGRVEEAVRSGVAPAGKAPGPEALAVAEVTRARTSPCVNVPAPRHAVAAAVPPAPAESGSSR